LGARWEVHGKIGLRHASYRCGAVPGTQTHLENMGAPKSKNIPLAHLPTETLDNRPTKVTQTGCQGLLLPM
jgi:hypothetical protein